MKLFVKKSKNKQGTKETLWIDFTHEGERYRKSLKLENTPANKRLAEKKIIPILQYKIISGEFFKNTEVIIPTVNEFIEESFQLRKGGRCSSTIYAHKKNYDKYIKPVFGNKKLNIITSNDITKWQNKLQEERLAKATILKVRSCISILFKDAINAKIIEENPVLNALPLKETDNPKVQRIDLNPFNLREIGKILNSAEGQDQNMLATFFFTGLRASELIGLEWDAIDFEEKTITVRRQIVNGKRKTILKTPKSKRIIPMIKALVSFLEKQFLITGNQNSNVFLTKRTNKHFHNAGKIREQIWIPTLKKANVTYRNLHQTRGTFISTLISRGEDINYVSKIAGHANVKITLERYSAYKKFKNDDFGEYFKNSLDTL